MGAAAVLTAGVLAVGCSDSDSDNIAGSPFFRPDNFPGGSVDENNLGDDQRAFSNAGQTVNDLGIYWNVSNGQALLLFTTSPNAGFQNGQLLYAAWFDGSRWHAPVEIFGESENSDSAIQGFAALWLNTTGLADPDAAGRNGDAIIVFKRQDAEPVVPGGSAIDEDGNVRLYGTYFDVSEAGAAATGTIIGGFNTLAVAIDDDNSVDVTDTDREAFFDLLDDGLANDSAFPGGTADNDPHVEAFGFASNSLHCTHEFGTDTVNVDSGDPTTFVHIFWTKDSVSGDPTALEPTEGDRLNVIQFPLDQTGNAIPQAGTAEVVDLGALDTANTVENVSDELVVHNGHIIYTVSGVDDTSSSDQVLMASVVTTAAGTNEIQLSSTQQDDSNDTADLPDGEDIYGNDHGLASTVIFFTEEGYDDDRTNGNTAQNRDLMVAELRVDAAGATTLGTGSPLEIDAFTGTLDTVDDVGDGDADGFGTLDGDLGAVSDFDTAINRTGTVITILIAQDNIEINDPDDADTDVGGASANVILWSTAFQTRRDPADARVLADSVPVAGPENNGLLESDLEAGGTTGPGSGTDQGDVGNVEFQLFLADGLAKSQDGQCDRGCVFQGNNLRTNWTYTQNSDFNSADDDNTILYLNGQRVALGATATAPPVITLIGQDEVEELDNDYSIPFQAVSMDAGDATVSGTPPAPTAQAGRVLVYFQSNENNETENGTGSFNEPRLYVSEQATTGGAGTRTLVSTDPAGGFQADAFLTAAGVLDAEIVPVNEDTVAAPNHVGTTAHIYWLENRNLPGSGFRFVTRSYDQADTTAATAVALADRYTPPLPSTAQTVDTDPVQLDNPWAGDLFTGFGFDTLINGNTVGVYFAEDGHIYYQETSGSATGYYTENGVPAPQLVDNDQEFSSIITFGFVVAPPECNDLAHSQVLFQKNDGGAASNRLFIRSHN